VWSRGLFEKLAEPVRKYKNHPYILARPEAKAVTRRYSLMTRTIVAFELGIHEEWKTRSVRISSKRMLGLLIRTFCE
jgi:hypothetical protein